MVVFYALLLVSLPADQRQRLLARSRTWAGGHGPASTSVSGRDGAAGGVGVGRRVPGVAPRGPEVVA